MVRHAVGNFRKQPSRGVLKKRCSENMQQIYRKTPMSKCDFKKVALHGCFPVNLWHIFRTPFRKNTSGRLLLQLSLCICTRCRLNSHALTSLFKLKKQVENIVINQNVNRNCSMGNDSLQVMQILRQRVIRAKEVPSNS